MKRYFALALLCLIAALGGCAERPEDEVITVRETETAEVPAETEAMEIEVQENRENELVFSISIDDFIDGYNSLYGRAYLSEASEWQSYTYDSAIHSDHKTTLHTFSEDKNVWSLPTVTVYTPADSDRIQEITVNFDEHSRTEELYGLYEEMCFYTLKTVLPDLSDGEIRELYTALNELAYGNVFPNEQGYNSESVPCVLYHKDGIGLYPYFAIGEWVHLCIIPVTQETVADFENKGVQIREIRPDDTGEETAERIEQECLEIAENCKEAYRNAEKIPADFPLGIYILSQSGFDAMESWLIGAGYPTVDTREDYPEYLANPDALYDFWACVQAGRQAETRYLRVMESGGVSCIVFCFDGSTGEFFNADVEYDSRNEPYISRLESRKVLDWELTPKGNFYYQILPSDIHYVDYEAVRLTPPDEALYDLTSRYILPVGYQATNLFLCDWNEADFGELSFNDVFEYLHLMGKVGRLYAADFPQHEDPYYSLIPAAVFEDAVLPYFDISRKELRERAMYDSETDSYPWLEQGTNEFNDFPFMEMEVTKYQNNPDGTLTLTVNVSSPELKTDDLFGHEVTVRPLEDGGFQYVANRITYQTEHGLPPSEPRLSSGENG